MTYRFILLLMGAVVLTGCEDQANQRLTERTKVEQEAAIQAENENTRSRVGLMEEDLALKHAFYQAAKGLYEGTMQTGEEEFKVRMTLTPSIPPQPTKRTRTTGEVEFDLTNLNFSVQIVQWKEGFPATAVGCKAQNVRPDINLGEMVITSPDCANLYRVTFKSDSLEGYAQPTTNANIYTFQAHRTNDASRKKL